MKRFFLPSLLFLAMGSTGLCADSSYVNNGAVQVPPMDPQLVAIDATNFINNGIFSVDLSLVENLSSEQLFTTSDTLNYTNTGKMIGTPGFDLETFPASVGQAQMAANFVNVNNGLGGGEIDIFPSTFAITGLGGVLNIFGTTGFAAFKARATNVLDSGLISMNNSGLIDISGQDMDLRRSRFEMTGPTAVTYLDFSSSVFTNFFWVPGAQLGPATASSPFFNSDVTGAFEDMELTNATPFFQSAFGVPSGPSNVVWRIIYLQDNSPTNVTKNVYFGPGTGSDIGNGAFHVEWTGAYRDPVTGQQRTNYFYLTDDPALRRHTNTFFPPQIPSDISFFQTAVKQNLGTPAAPGFFPFPAPFGDVTNDFSFVSIHPSAVLEDTNNIVGASATNLPGRIQLNASGAMNLANMHVLGPNYLRLSAPVNFLGNSNASIAAPYSDLNLGATNNSLTLTNLLLPTVAVWSGVQGAPSAVFQFGVFPTEMGGLQAWSGSYTFVDDTGVTNDVRVLLVNSALQPTTSALQQDVLLHATNELVISDALNIYRHFSSDATILTVTTNNNSAFSLAGSLNLLSSDIFWSSSLPNLKYLTNWGFIATTNLANFAGNMLSPTSDPNAATPYETFVNHGTVSDLGTFIRANYFENSGIIQEGVTGGIDIGVGGTAIATNGSFIAPFGQVSIAADTLFLSNGVVTAGGTLVLTPQCSLSDGYVFGNEFGHATNSVLPNVVTNGNVWSVGNGVQIRVKPPTADLLGTTITNLSTNSLDSITEWPGDDRGCSPAGYATNLALGRMILNADADPSHFTFVSLNGSNALYVDSIEFQGSATNTDANGNFQAVTIQPGMKIYYAQALMNGASIAEKLNGKNGGGFCWVSNYAGVYSSTNILYPDGNTYIFNQALVISPDLDSDGDGTVNRDDATPIPAGETFDIVNIGPQPCAGGGGGGAGGGGGTGGDQGSGGAGNGPGTLTFPTQPDNSSAISFALAQGSYNGLFYETNGVNPASSGFFTAKVTSKGGFTAKLTIGKHTYSVSGSFDAVSGSFSNSVTGKGLATLNVTLQLVNNVEITGQVIGDGWKAQLMADQAAFSSKNPPPAAWSGKSTLLLSTDEENSSTPTGDSFGTVTVSKGGDVQWSGVLPDGSKVTQKSALSQDGVWPLYSAPYGGAGSFIGWMQFTNDNSNIGGSAVWIAPAGSSGLYPGGLTNNLNATGSSVNNSIGTLNNSMMVLSGDSLLSSLTNHVMIFGKTGQSSDGTVKLSVNLKTGMFSGSAMDANSGQKLSFQGAVLEKSGIGGGFFLNADKSQGGKVYLSPAN